MNDDTLRSAFQNWEVLSGTPEEMLAYEVRLKRVLDEEAAIREAELREQEAHQKGMREGRQKGKEMTARRLLARGMEVADVIDITELAEERVIEIERELRQDT